jgi:hypothetical protein
MLSQNKQTNKQFDFKFLGPLSQNFFRQILKNFVTLKRI